MCFQSAVKLNQCLKKNYTQTDVHISGCVRFFLVFLSQSDVIRHRNKPLRAMMILWPTKLIIIESGPLLLLFITGDSLFSSFVTMAYVSKSLCAIISVRCEEKLTYK